jgi:hypothetical protein
MAQTLACIPTTTFSVPKGRVVLRSRSNVEMWDLFDTAAGGRKVLSYEGHRDVVYCLVQTGDLVQLFSLPPSILSPVPGAWL